MTVAIKNYADPFRSNLVFDSGMQVSHHLPDPSDPYSSHLMVVSFGQAFVRQTENNCAKAREYFASDNFREVVGLPPHADRESAVRITDLTNSTFSVALDFGEHCGARERSIVLRVLEGKGYLNSKEVSGAENLIRKEMLDKILAEEPDSMLHTFLEYHREKFLSTFELTAMLAQINQHLMERYHTDIHDVALKYGNALTREERCKILELYGATALVPRGEKGMVEEWIASIHQHEIDEISDQPLPAAVATYRKEQKLGFLTRKELESLAIAIVAKKCAGDYQRGMNAADIEKKVLAMAAQIVDPMMSVRQDLAAIDEEVKRIVSQAGAGTSIGAADKKTLALPSVVPKIKMQNVAERPTSKR